MSKTQWYYQERRNAQAGATGSATFDLPEKGFLPQVNLTVASTPLAVTNPAIPIADQLTRIEIIDGGNVIKSLTGNQVKALAAYWGIQNIATQEGQLTAVETYDWFPLQLGALIDGINYAPDMSQFSNPQLRVTWDCSITTTRFGMVCDAITTPAMKFSLLCEMIRDSKSYQHGYIKSTILKEFTQVVSTQQTIDVPRGRPLLGLGIEAGYAAKLFYNDVAEIELNMDNGAWVPFHFYAEEINLAQMLWFKQSFRYAWNAAMVNAKVIDPHMGYPVWLGVTSNLATGEQCMIPLSRVGGITLNDFDLATPTAIAAYNVKQFCVSGWEPFHLWYCPMRQIQADEEDSLDTSAFNNITLKVTSDASASTSMKPEIIAEVLMT